MTEARLERRFRPPGRDVARLYAGYYVAELLLSLTDEYDAQSQLFDLADSTLQSLAEVQPPVGRIVLRFELQALRLLGHLPSLRDCAECGARIEAPGRVAFGQLAGGVLCAKCRSGKRQVVSLSAAALGILARFADQEDTSWQTVEVQRGPGAEVRGVMNQYLSNLLGHRPRMHEYLGTL